ncbi:MAG: hypothetical protein JO252_14200 [Planctomycetaceae bacterium]|nr:hypothetical protein [Planctomycetaceae bacterium]
MTRLAGLLWEVSGFDMSGRSPSRIIGSSWIGLTIPVVPVRMNQARLLDGASLGVFRIAVAPGLRVFGRGSTRRHVGQIAAGRAARRSCCRRPGRWSG